MCQTLGLKAMNTWFKKGDARKVTFRESWVKKDPKQDEAWEPSSYAELDLCVAQERWKGMIKNVESNTRASLNTDHFPLEVTLQVKLGAGKSPSEQARGPRRDFKHISEEGWAGLARATREIARAIENGEMYKNPGIPSREE